MTEPLPPEPHDGLKADDNPEVEGTERDQSSYVARGGEPSGMQVSSPDAPAGTATGGVLDGVTLDPETDTVDGDTGPEHPGVRRSS